MGGVLQSKGLYHGLPLDGNCSDYILADLESTCAVLGPFMLPESIVVFKVCWPVVGILAEFRFR